MAFLLTTPVLRGTAQNPDTFFQAREAINSFYTACPEIVQKTMDKFAKITGRQYHLFDYEGAADATHVVVVMGSGAETVEETAKFLQAKGEKVGCVTVHLFRPFSVKHLLAALPASVKTITVLDRTKEPGGAGEPLYTDVITALAEGIADGSAPFKTMPVVFGGRYGLSSKEFTPAMAKAVFDNAAQAQPKNHFAVGIEDDVTHNSLSYDPDFSIETPDTRALRLLRSGFRWHRRRQQELDQDHRRRDRKLRPGLLRVRLEEIRLGHHIAPALWPQAHSRSLPDHKSHFRRLPPVLVPRALRYAQDRRARRRFPDQQHLQRRRSLGTISPTKSRLTSSRRNCASTSIDAHEVARKTGMGGRINTIMQTCFFAISGVLPRDLAIAEIKKSIKKTYGKRGEAVVQKNYDAVDQTLVHLHEVKYPAAPTSKIYRRKPISDAAPEFVKDVIGPMTIFEGDDLPVSAFPVDGTFPTATSQWEKRNIALEIPVWEPSLCIQCGKCAFVLPARCDPPEGFTTRPCSLAPLPPSNRSMANTKNCPGQKFTIQVAPEDCTGCALCVEACPSKDKTQVGRKAINMAPQPALREAEVPNWEFFLNLPDGDPTVTIPQHG